MAPPKRENGFTDLFAEVFLRELKYIENRRKEIGLDPQTVSAEHDRLSELLEESKKPENVVPDLNRVAPQTDIRPSELTRGDHSHVDGF